MTTRLAGRVVVVTGASSGVGRAVARAFGAKHAKVALLARNEGALLHAAREIEEAGGRALVVPTDVSSAVSVEEAAAEIEARLGPIDIWVNDAMASVFAPAHEVEPGEFARVTAVNYLGTVYGTKAALKRMRQRNSGTIIQIGSALAYCSIPLQSAYCASKAAIRAYSDSVRIELRHDGSAVKICMVQLPAVNTPQFDTARSKMPRRPQPVPPIFQPEVIARAVIYAARKRPRELWLGLPVWKAVLGRFFAPGLTEWYLARTGYQSQQTPSPQPAYQPDNLDEPVPGDRGAHGRFDARSKAWSPSIWLRIHPAIAALGVAAVVGGTAAALRR
ncbi:MAG: SDR family oxidoreductase [Deltaproteobacteria bacterium]|nr:SDR family oxidoreductase [Deltaproteobacteria bacterium]